MQLKGVGDIITVSEHGAYKLTLETYEGDKVSIRGLCLTQITCKFPKYPLKEIESDIRDVYKAQEEQIRSISESNVQYFLPWRVTHNDNSLSTPARLVYDA